MKTFVYDPGASASPTALSGPAAPAPEVAALRVPIAGAITEARVIAAARVLGEALRSLGKAAVDRLRPRTVLYLHLAEEALAGRPDTDVVRTEGVVRR